MIKIIYFLASWLLLVQSATADQYNFNTSIVSPHFYIAGDMKNAVDVQKKRPAFVSTFKDPTEHCKRMGRLNVCFRVRKKISFSVSCPTFGTLQCARR